MFRETVTNIEYKFSLGEISEAKFIDRDLSKNIETALLFVENKKGVKFYLEIGKFLPERCLPKFQLNRDKYCVSNSMLWASIVFWISDGYTCADDIQRFSNMRISNADNFYGEEVTKSIYPVTQTVIREHYVTPSLLSLSHIMKEGDIWWAPIPDGGYKSKDGRDLNLEVINFAMVRY